MINPTHHPAEAVLQSYRQGSLAHPFAVVVATHLSLCDECRSASEAADMVGGIVLERSAGCSLSAGLRAGTMAALDRPPPPPQIAASGIFPAPVMHELGGLPPQWRMLGGGVRQQILSADDEGSLRLLYIPAGKAVPEHGHRGLELTLVLQGSFHDSIGRFARGDVESAQSDLDHQPIADPGEACICLAATDAPLRFRDVLPRLLQPLFRI